MRSSDALGTSRTWFPYSYRKWGNLIPAYLWLFLIFNQLVNAPFPPAPSTVLLVLLNTVAVVLFVVRRDASRVGNKLDAAIAFAGTFVLALLRGPELRDTEVLPTIIQTIALMGWATSLMALGRSFGLVAADRGLVRHGPYRFVRHPIYAFEGLFSIGYIVAVPTFYTAILMTIWGALQVIRILREERILSGYEEYKRQVPWRILPGVW